MFRFGNCSGHAKDKDKDLSDVIKEINPKMLFPSTNTIS